MFIYRYHGSKQVSQCLGELRVLKQNHGHVLYVSVSQII